MAMMLRLTSSLLSSSSSGGGSLSDPSTPPRFLSLPCLLSVATSAACAFSSCNINCGGDGQRPKGIVDNDSRLAATRFVMVRAGDVATTSTGPSGKIDPLPVTTPEKGGSSKMEVAPKSSPKVAAVPVDKRNGTKPIGKKSVQKPLASLMSEDIIPALQKLLETEEGISDLKLTFEDNQLQGAFMKSGIPYSFWAYFPDGMLEGSRGFSLSSHGSPPSTVEPFLIDERKIDADLVVFWVIKRLFAQNILMQN